MSLIFFPVSIGFMSHVDFKKRQCRPVEFKGQGPHFIHLRPKRDPYPLLFDTHIQAWLIPSRPPPSQGGGGGDLEHAMGRDRVHVGQIGPLGSQIEGFHQYSWGGSGAAFKERYSRRVCRGWGR